MDPLAARGLRQIQNSRNRKKGARANDATSHSKRTVILIPHEKRRFPEKVSFTTSPGYINGPGDRKEAGLEGGGPSKVITDLAVLGFHHKNKMIQLESRHTGVSIEEIKENTDFELIIPKRAPLTKPPTLKQLQLLRSKINRHDFYTRNKKESNA